MTAQIVPIRVLITDDHAVVREGLAGFIRMFADIMLVGEAANGAEAVEKCRELHPDVVLMDVAMLGIDGVEATRRIREENPNVQVVILTTFVDENKIQDALRAGAIGYVLKSASAQEIVSAIRAAHQGDTILAQAAMKALISAKSTKPSADFNLKERELDILALLVEGLTNAEIAQKIGISLSTVKFHISTIFLKLKVQSRTEAVAIAVEHGLHRRKDNLQGD
jgi:NarL family two-component system response regulator LiaR